MTNSSSLLKIGNKKYYDRSNRQLGESITRGNTTKYKDRSGRDIGSAVKRGNTTYYYDRSGKRVKSLVDSGDNQRFYNGNNANTGSRNKDKFYGSQNRFEYSTSGSLVK
jgi:hypothetical protein